MYCSIQNRILSTSNCGGDQPSGDLRKEIKSDLSKESKLETISEEVRSFFKLCSLVCSLQFEYRRLSHFLT